MQIWNETKKPLNGSKDLLLATTTRQNPRVWDEAAAAKNVVTWLK